MNTSTTPETNAFLSDVADKLESAAANLESGMGATSAAIGKWSDKYMNGNFASKLAYTACYTFSYGVCFPIFVACHYIPKNNRIVEGFVDGGASASVSADQLLERMKRERVAEKKSVDVSGEFREVVEDGVGCLEPN